MFGIYAAVDTGNEMWFSCAERNGLYKIDKEKRKIEFVSLFDKEKKNVEFLHSSCQRWGEYLIFLPLAGENIIFYNFINNDMQYLDVTTIVPIVPQGDQELRILTSYIYDDKLWIFPTKTGASIKVLDLKTREFDDDHELTEFLNANDIQLVPFIGKHLDGKAERIYFTVGNDNKIVIYNLKDHTGNMVLLPNNLELSAAILFENNNLWFALRGKQGIGCMDVDKKDFTIYNNYPKDFVVGKTVDGRDAQPFSNMYVYKGLLWLIPVRGNSVLVFDMKEKQFSNVCKIDELQNKSYGLFFNMIPFLNCFCSKDRLIILPYAKDSTIEVDTDSFDVKVFSELPGFAEAYQKGIICHMENGEILAESDCIKVEDFLKIIVRAK